jgi:hypothetical protein
VSDRFELDPLVLPRFVADTGSVVTELDYIAAQTRRLERDVQLLGPQVRSALGHVQSATWHINDVCRQLEGLQLDLNERFRLLAGLEIEVSPGFGDPPGPTLPAPPFPLGWPWTLPGPVPEPVFPVPFPDGVLPPLMPGPLLPPLTQPRPSDERLFPPLWPETPPLIVPARPGQEEQPPTAAECNSALKILRSFERLCQKLGIKLSPKRLEELRRKLAAGTLRIDDLPAGLRRQFPARFVGKTIAEIEAECSAR